jgi:hypothetical protein
MKHLRKLAWTACATALVVGVGGPSTASATTLETNGIKQTGVVTLEATFGGSMTQSDTSNTFANTCRSSILRAADSTATTGTTVSGPVSTLSFSNCTHEKFVVDAPGSLSIQWIAGTTNGTVRWTGTEVTMPQTIGGSMITVNCKTSNTFIGTLTGTASGTSTIHINAVLNCGFFLPSAKWVGSYNITGHSVGVVE